MTTTIRSMWLAALAEKIRSEFPTAMLTVPSYVPDNLPACTVSDDTDEVSVDEYGAASIETAVIIEATEETGQPGETEAETMSAQNEQGQALLGRLVLAATSGDRTLGGLVDDVSYSSAAVQYPDDGQPGIGAGITCRVRWRHVVGDPYSHPDGTP